MLCNVCVHVYVNKLEPLCRDHFLSMLMLCSQVCLVLFLYLPFREIMLWKCVFTWLHEKVLTLFYDTSSK